MEEKERSQAVMLDLGSRCKLLVIRRFGVGYSNIMI